MSIDLGGPLLLVGAGKMGGALLTGWLEGGLDPACVVVQDPAPPPEISAVLDRAGISPAAAPSLAEPPMAVVLAVKPQIMDDVLPSVAPAERRQRSR